MVLSDCREYEDNLMNLFSPKCNHTTCKTCGNVFDPIGIEKRWADLCYQCRKPVMERDRRKDVVISWAITNWEKLEPQALEENKAQTEAYSSALNAFSKNQESNNQLTSSGLSGMAYGPEARPYKS